MQIQCHLKTKTPGRCPEGVGREFLRKGLEEASTWRTSNHRSRILVAVGKEGLGQPGDRVPALELLESRPLVALDAAGADGVTARAVHIRVAHDLSAESSRGGDS